MQVSAANAPKRSLFTAGKPLDEIKCYLRQPLRQHLATLGTNRYAKRTRGVLVHVHHEISRAFNFHARRLLAFHQATIEPSLLQINHGMVLAKLGAIATRSTLG